MHADISFNKDSDCNNMDTLTTKHDDDSLTINQPIKKRRINNVWSTIEQEIILDKELNQMGMKKLIKDREVESYIDTENSHKKIMEQPSNNAANPFGRKRKSCQSIQERISPRDWDRNKTREHVKSTTSSDPADVVHEIATLLCEKKVELIERCVSVLGIEKTLDFYFITEDIEESGGLMILNGTRRRTPGGVFLAIIQDSTNITKEELESIFKKQERKKARKQKNRSKSKVKQLDEFDLLLEQRRKEILMEKNSANDDDDKNSDIDDIVSPEISLEAGDISLTKEDSIEDGEIEIE